MKPQTQLTRFFCISLGVLVLGLHVAPAYAGVDAKKKAAIAKKKKAKSGSEDYGYYAADKYLRGYESTLKALSFGKGTTKSATGFLVPSLMSFYEHMFRSGIKTDREKFERYLSEQDMIDFEEKCPHFISAAEGEERKARLVEACDLVTKRDRYYNQYIDRSIAHWKLHSLGSVDRIAATLRRDGKVLVSNYDLLMGKKGASATADKPALIAKLIMEEYKRPLPKILQEQLGDAKKEFNAALQERSKSKVWNKEARYKDNAVASGLKRVVKGKGLKLKKYGAYDSGWTVKRGVNDIPIERTKDTSILTQKRGEKFCRVYDVVVVQDHNGGGRYGKTKVYNGGFEHFFVSACK